VSPKRGAVRQAGFTLVEVLVAIAIFAVLCTMVFSLVGTSLSIFRDGERTRELYEIGPGILDSIAEDLRGLASGGIRTERPREARLLVDRDADRETRLRLVRTLGRDAADRIFRLAGTGAKPTEVIDLRSDLAEALDGRHRATGGFVEVAYALRPMTDRGGREIAGASALVKGIRTPVGGAESLFSDSFDSGAGAPLALATVVEGVLLFEVECWGPETRSFDAPAGQGGAEPVWDSTRASLGDFRWHVGRESANDPADDVFPRRVLLRLVLDRPEDRTQGTFLSRALLASDTDFRADDASRLPSAGDPFPYVKIGPEWIRLGARSARDGAAKIVERGARGTVAGPHAAGAPIRSGIPFETVVEIAAPREPLER